MKYAFYVPNFGYCGEAAMMAELAAESEASGWGVIHLGPRAMAGNGAGSRPVGRVDRDCDKH